MPSKNRDITNSADTVNTQSTTAPRPRAVIYSRMSTDHQQYSTENQVDAIQEYAARYGIDILRTYPTTASPQEASSIFPSLP